VPAGPDAEPLGTWMGAVRCRERLGGLQKCYENALMTNEARKVFCWRTFPASLIYVYVLRNDFSGHAAEMMSPYPQRGIAHAFHSSVSLVKFSEVTFRLKPLNARDRASADMPDCFDFTQKPLAPISEDVALSERQAAVGLKQKAACPISSERFQECRKSLRNVDRANGVLRLGLLFPAVPDALANVDCLAIGSDGGVVF
jgi:hypothetical protein